MFKSSLKTSSTAGCDAVRRVPGIAVDTTVLTALIRVHRSAHAYVRARNPVEHTFGIYMNILSPRFPFLGFGVVNVLVKTVGGVYLRSPTLDVRRIWL